MGEWPRRTGLGDLNVRELLSIETNERSLRVKIVAKVMYERRRRIGIEGVALVWSLVVLEIQRRKRRRVLRKRRIVDLQRKEVKRWDVDRRVRVQRGHEDPRSARDGEQREWEQGARRCLGARELIEKTRRLRRKIYQRYDEYGIGVSEGEGRGERKAAYFIISILRTFGGY